MSPSPRRAWIEMTKFRKPKRFRKSPSPRRAWIEIPVPNIKPYAVGVALPTEGVD